MKTMAKVLGTGDSLTPTVLRVMLGLVVFPHGAQKLLGWFGGAGLSGTIDYFASQLGVPPVVTLLVVAAEFFGALALIFGLFGRLAAVGVTAVMLGAIIMVHGDVGFFMNWLGNQSGEGFEYHLLAIALAIGVLISGSGKLSLDRVLSDRITP